MGSKEARRRQILLLVLIPGSVLFSAGSLLGQPVETILTAEDAILFYGASVALDGDRAVVGSWCKVHVFEQAGSAWRETAVLPNAVSCFERDSGSPRQFGTSVALAGDRLVVGAPGTPVTLAGAVFVYQWDGLRWTETARLHAPDSARGDAFGQGVALDGDRLLVASPESHIEGKSGSVYVYEWDGAQWLEVEKLTPDPATPDRFGPAVSLQGDRFVIGGLDAQQFNGIAYVFERDDGPWHRVARLVASDGGYTDAFGRSVSMDGDRIVIGAPGLDPPARPSAAYVFERIGSEWTEAAKLTLDDPALWFFGTSVAVKGDRLVVGRRSRCFVDGALYVYQWDGAQWTETTQVGASNPVRGQGFAGFIDFDGARVLVGAPGTDHCGGLIPGAAFVYQELVQTTATEQIPDARPDAYALHANYPNPFQNTTTLTFDIPAPAHATLTVYDALGRVVQTLEAGVFAPGRYQTTWDASSLPSGLYACRLQAGPYQQSRLLMRLK